MKQFYTTILMAVISLACFADGIEGLSPVLNNSYYLYNVATGMYLTATPDGSAQLSATGTEFALSLAENGAYKLTSTSGDLSTSFLEQTILAGNGQYNGWKVRKLDGQNNVYALACMQDETKAYAYLIYNNTVSGLKNQATMPAIAEGQWMLVHKGDEGIDPDPGTDPDETISVSEVVLNESSTEFVLPENMEELVTVKLYRSSMTPKMKSAICLPFSMNKKQVKEVFGNSTQVLSFSRCVGASIYYSIGNSIEAGVPYVLIPTKERSGDYYEIKDVESSSFVSEPEEMSKGIYVFKGVFQPTELLKGTYVFSASKGTLGALTGNGTIKGYRSYFESNVSNAAPMLSEFIEDETTGISEIVEFEKYDIYNISGQLVKKNAQTFEDLTPGIYVVNGKKFVVK